MSAVAEQGDGKKPCTSCTSTGTAAAARPTTMELEAYKSLVSLLNAEEAAFWSRNNLLFAVHGALLAATAGILGNTDKVLAPGANPQSAALLFTSLLLLALFGLGMAVAWLFMVARGKRIADTITDQLKGIEEVLARNDVAKLDVRFHAFRNFGADLGPPGTPALSPPIETQRAPVGPLERFLGGVRLADVWLRVGWTLAGLWLAVAAGLGGFVWNGHARPPAPGVEAVTRAVAAAEAAASSAAEAASAAGRAALAAERAASAAAQRTKRGNR